MNVQISQDHSKQMAMTATECNRLMLENAKKSAKKWGQTAQGEPSDNQGPAKIPKNHRR